MVFESPIMPKSISDAKGTLTVIESLRDVPFDIRRLYYITGVQTDARRGFHAHRQTRQAALCIQGQCQYFLDDGSSTLELKLNPRSGILPLEPLVWHEMYGFSADCILMVMADSYYDESDYIRDYGIFKQYIQTQTLQ